MEALLNKGIKEIIDEHPDVEKVLDEYGIGCGPCNVGICLLGNFEVERPSPAALATLDRLVAEIRTHYKLPATAVKPHSYWKGTLCPGRNMEPWLARQSG